MNIVRVKSILQVGGSLLCVAAITFVYVQPDFGQQRHCGADDVARRSGHCQ